jgi:hypothetical protein
MVWSTGAAIVCLDGRLCAFLSAVFGDCFLLAIDFGMTRVTLRTLDFVFFGAARFVTFLRADVARPLRRFELLLATRLFDLAMAASSEIGDLSLYRPMARVDAESPPSAAGLIEIRGRRYGASTCRRRCGRGCGRLAEWTSSWRRQN